MVALNLSADPKLAHIDLQRTFSPASEDGEDESELGLRRYLRKRNGEVRDWNWLLSAPLVVVLNEAGAGKTHEFQQQTERLRVQGEEAFFLRIERLCRLDAFAASENPEEAARLRRWLGSRRPARFFLDSVDEAKLPRDLGKNPLHASIRQLEQDLGTAIRRSTFAISSRPSAWSAALELQEIRRLAARLPKADATPPTRFVRLDPLSVEQQRKLAEHVGAPAGFMPALLESGADPFATTPLDLKDFVEAYAAEEGTGRPGAAIFASLSDIVDKAITRRAGEFGSDNPRNTLPATRIREGAKRLACACVLAQELAIRLPGENVQGVDALALLAAPELGWSRRDVEQLLICGLFTATWLGAVRFHHRRTMERLAAEGFHDLLAAGMDVQTLAGQLTPAAFDEVTTPAPFIETLGWLGTLNPGFRHHLLTAAPQILIEGGDPGVLPIPVREAALHNHVRRYETVRYRHEWFEESQLRRFAHPMLEPVCREILGSATAYEPKSHILHLIVAGELRGCADAALLIAADPMEQPSIRTRAAETIDVLGNPVQLAALRDAALQFRGPPADPDGHARHERNAFRIACVVACRRSVMSLRQALSVLIRLEARDKTYTSNSERELAAVLVDDCPPAELPRLVRWLRRLCWRGDTRRFGSHNPPRWTALGWFLLPAFEAAVARLISEHPQVQLDPEIARDADRVMAARGVGLGPLYRFDDDEPDPFAAAVRAAPNLRRTLFLTAARGRSKYIFSATDLLGRVEVKRTPALVEADLSWLVAEYESGDVEERPYVFDAITTWIDNLDKASRRHWIARVVRLARQLGDRKGLGHYRLSLRGQIFRARQRVRWWWRRQYHLRLPSQRAIAYGHAKLWLRAHASGRRIARADNFGLIYALAFEDQGSDDVIGRVRKRHGDRIADAFQAGLKAYALRHESRPLDEPGTFGDRIAMLGWAQLALDNPAVLQSLTDEAARNVLTVFLRGNHFPDWLSELAERHPEIWRKLIGPRISSELAVRTIDGSYRHSPALSLASRQTPALCQVLAQDALGDLRRAPTPSATEVRDAATIILADDGLAADLASLAARQARSGLAEGDMDLAAAWVTIWLRLEPAAAWREVRRFRDLLWRGDDRLMAELFVGLAGGSGFDKISSEVLGEMAIDALRHVRAEDDDRESGLVTGRHRAQQLREGLPEMLSRRTTAHARVALTVVGSAPEFAAYPGWIPRLLEKQAIAAAAPASWSVGDVSTYFQTWMHRPTTTDELHDLILRHLTAIAINLDTSEFDVRGLFAGAKETEVRAYIGQELERRARGWYSVTQETVTAGENRTDLRIEGRTSAGEIVIVELKLLNRSWSGQQLVDHLKSQLADQYLISRKVRQGVYLLVDLGELSSWTLSDGAVLGLDALTDTLTAEAAKLVDDHPVIDRITVQLMRIDSSSGKGRDRSRKVKWASCTTAAAAVHS